MGLRSSSLPRGLGLLLTVYSKSGADLRHASKKGHKGPMNVMHPYSECISLSGYQSGACSNCIYCKQGGRCNFSDLFFADIKAKLGAIPSQLHKD